MGKIRVVLCTSFVRLKETIQTEHWTWGLRHEDSSNINVRHCVSSKKETQTGVLREFLFTCLLFLSKWVPLLDFSIFLSMVLTSFIPLGTWVWNLAPPLPLIQSPARLCLFFLHCVLPTWITDESSPWSLSIWPLPTPIQPSNVSEIDFSKLELLLYFPGLQNIQTATGGPLPVGEAQIVPWNSKSPWTWPPHPSSHLFRSLHT